MSVVTHARRAAMVFVVLAAIVVTAPTPTGAAPGDLTCVADWTVEFTPGLTVQPHSAAGHNTAALTSCTGTQVGITGTTGTLDANSQGTMSCTGTGQAEGEGQIHWDGPGSPPPSIFNFTMSLQVGSTGLLLAFDGEVTSGPLAGDSIYAAFVPTDVFLIDCLLGIPVEEANGLSPLTFQ